MIVLTVKLILKPILKISVVFGCVDVIRRSPFLDSIVKFVPLGFFDFAMFTSLGAEDMALQQDALLGVEEAAIELMDEFDAGFTVMR